MAASEKLMGELHDLVAQALIAAIQGVPMPDYEDEEGNTVEGEVIPPSAAIIQAASKFLKDNEITCAPGEDNSIGELQELMKQRLAKTKARKVDMQDATEQAGFLSGLPN